jgi:isopropylmalate/homocitrate/citramalate synthase
VKYKLKDGTEVPLFEADYQLAFEVRRKDRVGAIVGDPKECIEARAMCNNMEGVIEAYIGAGKDAYVVFKATSSRPFIHALHFTIPADAGRVRDRFDMEKALKSQTLMLRPPSKGRTLTHRRQLANERHKAVKAGAPVKKRGTIAKTRITRIGVPLRPRAKIVKGVVSLEEEQAVT